MLLITDPLFVYSPRIQPLQTDLPVDLSVLRLDLLDNDVSGNKWFKLKHNLERARTLGLNTVITFGGAHSNHIAATAAACLRAGIRSVGLIRGAENEAGGDTLRKAREDGMVLKFISRKAYSEKNSDAFSQALREEFGAHLLIPEGGNNREGLAGCMEITAGLPYYDYIFCACGTGATFAGIVASALPGQVVGGISTLKGPNSLPRDVMQLLLATLPDRKFFVGEHAVADSHFISNQYAFNGYAAYNRELIHFKEQFENRHGIPLDYIYTCKMFFAVTDLAMTGIIRPGARVLAIHTGGLQGNPAFEKRYQLKPSR